MSVSTDYDYRRYALYNSMISSASTQQSVQNKKLSDNTDTAADSAQSVSAGQRKSPLYSLVESGTITSDQEKAIKDALEASRLAYQTQAGAANSTVSSNPLDSLVSNGTITADQASTVKNTLESDKNIKRMPPPPPPQKSGESENSDPISDTLDSLVSSGAITSDQKNSILSALQTAFKTSNSQKGSSATETTDSTTATASASSAAATDPLDSLVSAGTITADQENAVKSALEADGKVGKMPPPPPPEKDNDKLSSILESLINDGKITTDQRETILNALQTVSQSDNKTGSVTATDSISALKTAFESALEAYQNQYSYDDDESQNNFSANL